MLHVGLDLSRKRVDVCLLSEQGEIVDELAAPFDNDGLCRLTERVGAKFAGPVRAVVREQRDDLALQPLAAVRQRVNRALASSIVA